VLFLVTAGLYFAKDFLIPLSIGAVLATLFLPFCKWMEIKKIPRAIAALTCLLVLLLAIAGVGTMLGWEISALTKDFATLKLKVTETVDGLQEYIFDHLGIPIEKQSQILQNEQPSVGGMVRIAANSLMKLFTDFIFVMTYVFLLLYYRTHIKQFILKLSSPSQREEMEHVVNRAAHVSQQYLVGLAKMIVCLWIMYGIGFSLLGVKNFLFFAILCGLLEIVPYIGNITGTTLTVLVAAVQGASLPMLGGIAAVYGFVQFFQGWVLEPLILGPQVKINPLFTIIALVIGELVWGIAGIFLAIPLMAMFKIVCDHIETLKPFGFLIGEIESAKKEPVFVKEIRKFYKKGSR